MSDKRKFWLIGLALAGIGVVLARVVSLQFDQPGLKVTLYIAGVLLAFAGLGVIMYAMRKHG
jgi:protein-S-isoprenylcysteine O-methyltransferase Ste14